MALKTISKLLEHYRHEASEFASKSFSTLTFALLTIGFKESQQPRSSGGSGSTVGNIIFERLDSSIPNSGMKNLYVPRVNSEGLFSLLRGSLYRSALKINKPLMQSIVPPNDLEDRIVASTHEGLSHQWGKFALIRPLPDVPSDLQEGAAKGDRLAALLSGKGLFIQYLQRTGEDRFAVDLELYRTFEPVEGFEHLGFKAELCSNQGQLQTKTIILGDQRVDRPDTETSRFSRDWQQWERAQDIAMATLILDTIAIRHLLAAHLVNVAMIGHFRNCVPEEHPIARLLDPHTIGTIGIHFSQVPVLIGEYGFLSYIFPYEQSTINKMIDTVALTFDFMQYDIEAELLARNMQSPLPFEAPFQNYWLKLFQEYRAGVAEFINSVYSSDAEMQKDVAIVSLLSAWTDSLLHEDNRTVFKYLNERKADALTRDDLTRLIANYLFLTTVTHEVVGNGLLQYALQGHLMPVAVPLKGRRPSVKRFLNLASILLWTSLPKSELGSFYERTYIPESSELERQVNEFWELIRHLMDSFQHDLRLPGAGAPGHLERSVNQ